MVQLGYAISSEEHRPNDLVTNAKRAEEIGFTFALISDHFHPWIDKQGQAPFVWSVIGGIAQATTRLELGTGVTCPTIRIHPAIIAQAAATAAAMMPGRFFFGIGTGENLNEHVVGQGWPPIDTRLEMLEEAVEVIRLLWQGGTQSFYGDFYDVENARIYTLPDELPKIMVAVSGEKSVTVASEIGDGIIGTSPDKEMIDSYVKDAGQDKPRYGQLTVCYAANEADAVRTAHEWWPTAGLTGQLNQELALPAHFEQATQLVTEEHIKKAIVCGPDAQKHIEEIQKYIDAGYSHVYIHQVGPDQEGFFQFYQREILPRFQ